MERYKGILFCAEWESHSCIFEQPDVVTFWYNLLHNFSNKHTWNIWENNYKISVQVVLIDGLSSWIMIRKSFFPEKILKYNNTRKPCADGAVVIAISLFPEVSGSIPKCGKKRRFLWICLFAYAFAYWWAYFQNSFALEGFKQQYKQDDCSSGPIAAKRLNWSSHFLNQA